MAILAVLLPGFFVCGIVARRTVPVISAPSELHRSLPEHAIRTEADLWPGKRIKTLFRTTSAGSLTAQFRFESSLGPDVLVYWIPRETLSGAALPESAQLLGPLSSQTTFPIPAKPGEVGHFILYSLANQKIVAISKRLPLPRT
jgi:hypothetical protein